jgi:hypothetical protein
LDPGNWNEPDGQSFFGWRFDNRDANLDRWLLPTFMTREDGGPDTVLAAVPNLLQSADIGILPANSNARIQLRPESGDYGEPTPDLTLLQVDMSRWRMKNLNLAGMGFVGRITAPHLNALTENAMDHKHFVHA